MPKSKPTLLASAPTITGIAECINKYFYSDCYIVDPVDLSIRKKGSDVPHPFTYPFQVRLVRGRYRFESVS